MMDAAKAGHGGTLDPLATGILPIAFGEATKTIPYIMDREKRYRFTLRWGEARNTDDAEGEITERSDVRPPIADIRAILPTFTGRIMQTPPIFSAIKIDGERAYKLARSGENVTISPREVTITDIRVIDIAPVDPDCTIFEVTCGKGVYIRSLARDIARALGSVGYVAALRRLAVGPFTEKNAISLDKLEELSHIAPPIEQILPIETALDDIPALDLTDALADYLQQGRAIQLPPGKQQAIQEDLTEGDILCAMSGGRLVAMVRYQKGAFCPVRVLNQ